MPDARERGAPPRVFDDVGSSRAEQGRIVAVTEPVVGRTARSVLGGTFVAYLIGTAVLYFWGPWTYPMEQGSGQLTAFLIAVHVAFAIGYYFGIRGQPRASVLTFPVEKLVLASVVLQLALLLPSSHFATGQWIPNPWAATKNLAGVYTESLARRETGTPYVNYIRIVMAPLLALAVPLAVFYWRRLPLLTRLLFAVSVIGNLALYISMGTNAAVGEWVAVFPWFVLAAHMAGVQRVGRRGWITAGIVLTVSALLMTVLFTATMVQRTVSFAATGYLPGIGAYIGTGAPRLNSVTGFIESPHTVRPVARIGWDGLAAYLTQGYFAVYLSLQQPFVPCYGVGNSVFLQRQAVRLTADADLLECPYPVRIQKRGWHASVYWATIYPWIASDVTFSGTVVVVFFIAWLSGRVWLDVLGGRNPVAVALLGQLLLMLYYFPAHNRVMQIGEGVCAFVVLMAVWLFTRERRHAGV